MAESQNIEWKESWRDEYLKWICGFANASGGKLYIGKTDDGRICGVSDFEKLLEDIPNKIISQLGVFCDVNLLIDNDKYVIEIIVPSYDVPISFHGKYHYRVGSTKQELQGNALNDFLLRKMGKTWDDVLEPKAAWIDINEKAIASFRKGAIKSNRLPIAEDDNDISQLFQNMRLMEGDKLKRAALILFGNDPRKFYINSFIKIGRFGKSDFELLSQEIIEGNAFNIADYTLEILDKKYFRKRISYDGLQRVEITEYPYEAIREMLLNAIVHRQYSGPPIQISVYDDKLMIWNFGLLPESITLEDLKLKHASHPRNPILADVFFKGGLIEAWGRGTLKIFEACKLAGLPNPIIEEMSGGICVTLFKNRINDNYLKQFDLNERQIRAIGFIKEKGKITNKDYQELNDCSRNTASNDLANMHELSIIEASGQKGAGAFYFIK